MPWSATVPTATACPASRAEAILADGSGSQWLPAAVDSLLAEVHARGPVVVPRLDAIGAKAAVTPDQVDDLIDACLPEGAAPVAAR